MPNENLQIVSSSGRHAGQTILTLKGPLNIQTLFSFHTAVRADSPAVMILDFTAVPYVDSAGLGALVAAQVAAQRSGQRIAIVASTSRCRPCWI